MSIGSRCCRWATSVGAKHTSVRGYQVIEQAVIVESMQPSYDSSPPTLTFRASSTFGIWFARTGTVLALFILGFAMRFLSHANPARIFFGGMRDLIVEKFDGDPGRAFFPIEEQGRLPLIYPSEIVPLLGVIAAFVSFALLIGSVAGWTPGPGRETHDLLTRLLP